MKKVLKQVVGIDVAQKELVSTLGRMYDDFSIELYSHRVFKNSEKGILSLLDWTKKQTIEESGVHFVMEATGVYHQRFAYYLDEHDYKLSIVLPNKICNYARTLDNKTITDKTSSEAIAQFGLERKLDLWHAPNQVYSELQQLTRERDQIVAERSTVKNQLHAETTQARPVENSVRRLKERIVFLNRQEREIKQDIDVIVERNEEVKNEIKNITTIPGVGKLTAVIALAETNGFELIRSKKQLTSYAGLDVKQKQSGTSVKGKPRISKKGNRSLRKAMYLPSLSAVKYDENFKGQFVRIVSKHGIKKKGLIAVQRKMLELIYTLFKNKTTYDKDYETKKSSAQNHMV